MSASKMPQALKTQFSQITALPNSPDSTEYKIMLPFNIGGSKTKSKSSSSAESFIDKTQAPHLENIYNIKKYLTYNNENWLSKTSQQQLVLGMDDNRGLGGFSM